MDGAPVRRMRLGAEAPEIGVDEASMDRPGNEFRAHDERSQKGQIGLRPNNHGVIELLPDRGQRLGSSLVRER